MTSHPPTSDRFETARGGKGRAIGASAVVAALALGTFGAAALPAHAAVSPTATVVINEVYGGGGNAGAALTNDFVELFNVSDAPVDLTGWSLQYASPTGKFGTTNNTQTLSGTIPARSHFLVQEAEGMGGTDALPEPDARGALALGGTNGKIALSRTAAAVVGPDAEAVVDYVAWGTGAPAAGGAPAPATSSTTSVSRTPAHANTANNAADFVAGEPTPHNSTGGEEPTEPQPDATAATIAQIQGTGDVSPLVGARVVTEGVVTARYPGFGDQTGYVIQAAGSGAPLNGASTAVWVISPSTVGDVALGDSVQVTGAVSEKFGVTRVTVAAGGVTDLATPLAAPVPVSLAWPKTAAERESLESMLFQPLETFTVSDTYSANQYGEVGLAVEGTPLRQPTDVAEAGSPEAAAVEADNLARGVILDDGTSLDYLKAENAALTPPYISLDAEPIVVGGTATVSEPVIVHYDFNEWRFEPTEPVSGDGTGAGDGVTFTSPRTAKPENVGGDLSVASFNVLNYFTSLGADNVPACKPYAARNGQQNSVNNGCDYRGAWDAADLKRQQDKIVAAIDGLDASVVGLMEIENSAKTTPGEPDKAVSTLVDALNAASGGDAPKWAFVPSSKELPDPSQRDVIANAIIYQPALATRVGASRALATESGAGGAFDLAREPIAQVFAPAAGGGENFLFAVNHFKSKGGPSNGVIPAAGDEDRKDGQGFYNATRVKQAIALAKWVDEIKGETESVALVGDFNSYGQEDPLQELYAAGYSNAGAELAPGESSYSFGGLAGSLDHVLLNSAARARATDADIWNINSGESIALEYSRYGYHGTLFYNDDVYRSSDHDPVKVGLSRGAVAPVDIDILTINDFHGRLEADAQNKVAGAAVVAGAVAAHREENENTLFVSAGDNIGASTFTSLIQQDNPTIDTLVDAGLDVSAVGNHEFDRGFADLKDRVLPRFGGNTDPNDVTDAQRARGASYGLGANVYDRATGEPALPEYALKEVDGVTVAFIGTVTPDTATMVDPAGIANLRFGDQLEAANRVADELAANDEADVIILLAHSGAATSDKCDQLIADKAGFGALATGASPEIDAIVSAHTHQTYSCEVPVDGAPGTTRPVIQASEYGKALGKLELSYDPVADEVLSIGGSVLPLFGAYPADEEIAAKVAGYVAQADEIGAQPIGKISGDILRGGAKPGDDRGVESSMGNWVADVYLWATSENPAFGGTPAQISLMNPGGLRADLLKGDDGVVTYKEAALVQPFANTLVTVTLTGAQIEEVLEQQWKASGDRPKLHLGVSEGFSYTYVEDAPQQGETVPRGGRVVSMSYLGEPIAPTDTFTVVTNSFLANGGDGFAAFADGTDRTDTGQVDLDATLASFSHAETVDPAPVGRAILATDSENPGTDNPGTDLPDTEAPNGTWATVTLGSDRVEQGGTLEVAVTGLEPGQQIGATLFSEPIVVSRIPAADASGGTSFVIAIPADFAVGEHELVVTSEREQPIRVGVTVLAHGQLAVTGSEVPLGLALGAGFLLVAGGLAFALRRRSPMTR